MYPETVYVHTYIYAMDFLAITRFYTPLNLFDIDMSIERYIDAF